MKVKEGDRFPDFSVNDDEGNNVTLDAIKGKTTVIYFYPKDDTPGCTKEACNFRDDLEKFKTCGVPIYGVSVDSLESHKKFKKKYNLDFPLLSDKEKKLVEELGIKSIIGNAKRVTFVLDADGKIIKIYPNVSPDKHSKELVEFINGLS